MEQLTLKFNDGGRSQYFKATKVGDCVTRAIAIASGRDYKEVYRLLTEICGTTPRNGVLKAHIVKAMKQLGATWHPLATIGSGCKAHLRAGEIPMQGRIVCRLSKHLVAVIDGEVNDTYDCSREGYRCVYGYWKF